MARFNRRQVLGGTAAASGLALMPQVAVAMTAPRPNIVIILADDLGYADISCQNPEGSRSPLQTPNIDALAAAGARYTDAHSPASVCSPTRYGLLTGRYGWRSWMKSSVIWSYGSPMLRGRKTVAHLLRDAGYTTALVGKWHLGFEWARLDGGQPSENKRTWPEETIDLAGPITHGPIHCGFQTYYGVDIPNLPPYAYISDNRIVGPLPTEQKPKSQYGFPGLMQPGWNVQSVFSHLKAASLARLAKSMDEGKPFFLHLPLTAPHTPISPSPAFVGKTSLGPIGDFIVELDAFVGDVVAMLAARGVADNTLIIFASDNGSPAIIDNDSGNGSLTTRTGFKPNAPWGGAKREGDLKEGGHRIPLILKWPAQIAPAVIGRTVCLTDLATTITDVAGLEVPSDFGEDSLSLAPDWSGAVWTRARTAIIHHSNDGQFAIRQGSLKLIEGRDGWELYNLDRDPSEAYPLDLAVPANWKKMRELADLLHSIQAGSRTVQ